MFYFDLINKVLINERATIVSFTPTLLRQALNTLPKGKHYNEYFRCVFVGNGVADNWTLMRCNMLDIPVLQTYGMTETTASITALNYNDAEIKAGSCGQPYFTDQIRITDINQDNIGDIEVKSPSVAVGYLNNKALYQSRFTNDGYFKTGDVGYLDDDNFLYLKGRADDLIYTDDKILYPEEIENIYRSVNGIEDICIVGKIGADNKMAPVAYLSLKDQYRLTSGNLKEFGQHNLLNYQVPVEFRLIKKMPKATNGRILRWKLKGLEFKII
ncbi:AMP-binding protein [Companilactobacillus halodurans]|uniref:AMP-binding protein n=1 Tax=Companilactobacillus halodurans TaxID=2584183 RepID=A0A5P0ZY89_9LACO|nr:AMP-binding protein [Companilactobacillus halodurans]MQS76769.1 AMP-binding protein [Companilactobacillus halodurans]MQS98021.1 AMP-binding protein [Companilactobacillus halodurans]